MSIDMYLPGVPQMAADLRTTPHAVTAAFSVFVGGLCVGQLLVGPWSDRVGRRLPILAGLLVYLGGCLCSFFAPGIEVFLGGRVLQALGVSAVTVAARAVVRDLFDEHDAARFFSAITLVTGLTPVVAPLAGTGILLLSGWRAVFLTMALAATVPLLASLWLLRESRSPETRLQALTSHPLRSYRELLRNRRLVGFLLAGGFNAACFFTYLSSAPLILMKTYGLDAKTFSTIIALNALGLLGASQFNRYLLRTRRPQNILFRSGRNAVFLAAAFAAFALTLYGGLTTLLILIFMAVASMSIVQNNTLACALSIDPHRAGAAAALFGVLGSGLSTIMSYLGGLLYDGTPRPTMILVAVNLMGTAAALRYLALPATDLSVSTGPAA
jgi:DHA1 family bicyclomycin/chloramphenicol resistance-like MFS transporter